MRCTKCGYITFDHLQSCEKCSTNLEELSSQLKGTAVKAEPIFFLQVILEAEGETEPQFEGQEDSIIVDEEQEEDVTISLDEQETEEAEAAVLDLEEEEITEVGSEAGAEELEPALSMVEEDQKVDIEIAGDLSLEGKQTEDESPAAALSLQEEEAETPAHEEEEEFELSLETEEEDSPAGEVAAPEAEEKVMPEGLELKDISAPGENLTASLEEIDLNDLMAAADEGGELALEEEDLALEEEIDDEEVEKIFDLSDIISEEDTEEASLKPEVEEMKEEESGELKEEAEAVKEEEKNLADLEMELDLKLENE